MKTKKKKRRVDSKRRKVETTKAESAGAGHLHTNEDTISQLQPAFKFRMIRLFLL